jgi:hypothetical protein
MPGRLMRVDVEAACDDLKNRTLSHIGLRFGRLLCLASTRDYNTGTYYHDGLAFRFSEQVAAQALAEVHREEFIGLVFRPLEDFVNELQLYIHSVAGEPQEIIRVWQTLEPYRVTIPIDSDPLTAGLFLANIKIALAIVARAVSRRQAAR